MKKWQNGAQEIAKMVEKSMKIESLSRFSQMLSMETHKSILLSLI